MEGISNETKRNPMKKMNLFVMAVCGFLLAGCASVPMTSAPLDSQAKQFAPEAGKSSIYVYRSGIIGQALVFQVMLDGRIVGAVAPDTYQLLSVPPGDHTVAVFSPENLQQQKVTAVGGRNYFFKVTVSMGWATGHANIDPTMRQS
jgi:uncharacterized protein DUF2846